MQSHLVQSLKNSNLYSKLLGRDRRVSKHHFSPKLRLKGWVLSVYKTSITVLEWSIKERWNCFDARPGAFNMPILNIQLRNHVSVGSPSVSPGAWSARCSSRGRTTWWTDDGSPPCIRHLHSWIESDVLHSQPNDSQVTVCWSITEQSERRQGREEREREREKERERERERVEREIAREREREIR